MSTKRTGAKALALLACSALVLTACATSEDGDTGDTGTNTSAAPVTFNYGYEQEYASYNANTGTQAAVANVVVNNQVLRGFWYYSPDGKVAPDTEFGTYEKTSDDPLTVKYTFNEKAVWSDGDPIDCDDAVLLWLANSGTSGEKGFSAASTSGYEDHGKPACADGEKTFTVTYKKVYADWAALYGSFIPAHIVEKEGGVADIIKAADEPKSADTLKATKFYNTGFDMQPGQLKPEVTPSAGPYKLSKWSAKQSLTLEANDKWWGTPAKAKTIVFRYIAGPSMTQALQNGEINAMDPQPQVDLINQLKGLGAQANYKTADQYTYEHFDVNYARAFKDPKVREAFAKCIPRQQILDNLIKPVNPDAQLLQSRFVFPFQPDYSAYIEGIGAEPYNTVDIEGAKKLLDEANPESRTVRVGWRKDPAQLNKRRQDQVALLKASCDQAGFKIEDAGTPDFFDKAWPNGNWDVAMFAWAGSPLVTGSTDLFQTGGGANPGKYSNKKVDELLTQLNGEVDPAKQVAIQKQIDTEMWKDLMTIPLYAFPGVVATSKNAEGVEFNATNAGLTWNAYAWNLKQ